MKLNKSTLLILGTTFVLAGCNSNQPETPHEHVFDTNWSFNDESHWRKAICEHTDLSIDLGSHTYNNAGFCTVCGKEISSHFKTFKFDGKNCSANAENIYHVGDTISFNIIPDEGYKYPYSINVTKGLSEAIYDNETGVVSGLVTDNIEIFAISRSLMTTTYISSIEVEVDGYADFCFKQDFSYDVETRIFLDDFYFKLTMSETSCEKKRYTYNELNQLIKYERNFENGVYEKYNINTYNENGTLKDETTYRIRNGQTEIWSYETYSYDELNRLTEIIYYDADCVTPESKEVHTYTENEEVCWHYNYNDGVFEESFGEKTVTTVDVEKGIKIVESYDIYFPDDISSQDLVRRDIYDLESGKLIEFFYSTEDYYYTYNEMGDLKEKKVIQREWDDTPSYQSNGMKIVYNDESKPVTGTYGTAENNVYDEAALDFTFNFDECGLIDYVLFNKKDQKNIAKIKYEYVEISNDVVVPEGLLKAYEPGNYPIFPDTEIFESLVSVILR